MLSSSREQVEAKLDTHEALQIIPFARIFFPFPQRNVA